MVRKYKVLELTQEKKTNDLRYLITTKETGKVLAVLPPRYARAYGLTGKFFKALK